MKILIQISIILLLGSLLHANVSYILPGDCNNDGIVNEDDSLQWGLAYGQVGLVRPNATTSCNLQLSPDWSNTVNGVNAKHSDCDGNGVIDNSDSQIILQNFGCTSPVLPCHINNWTALKALYESTDGDNWHNNTGWPTAAEFATNPTMSVGTNVDTWYGVTTDGDGCVICIDMDGDDGCNTLITGGNNLVGNIPPEIGNLTNLTNLHLSNDELNGSIPPEIGNLTNLVRLDLMNNQLTGSIPPELGDLTNLEVLNLHVNELSGCYDSNLLNLCNQLTSYLISNGNNFDAPWEDFCNTGAGACLTTTDDVFPGDYNTDGIVNTEDALYWGLAEGFSGVPRPNATTDCTLQACNDWSQSVDGINSKHQDGDGNGTIDGDDLQVIISNYGCINNYTTPSYASGTPIYRVQPQGINNDEKYQYDIYVENGSGAAAIAHGLAFTVTSDVIPISAIAMSTTGSSLHPDEVFAIPDGNQCHAVLTRTDNFDVTCGGPIAILLIETDDVPVGVPFEINVTSGAKIKADATLDNITGASAFGMYNGIGPISTNLTLNASVTHEQCDGLGSAIAIPSGGIQPYTYAWSTGASSPQVNNLASGTYTITVTDDNGISQHLNLRINGQTPIYDTNGNLLCGNICPEYLAPSGITGNGLYGASNALNSDATIPTGNTAQYKAGQVIELKSGFEVQPDAEFSAEIEDCQ